MEPQNKSEHIGILMREVMSLLHCKMDKTFGKMGITAPQGMVLGTLTRIGKMKVSDLSDALFLSNSTISGIIDRMEKQGIVERERSEDDKRVVYIKLTPKAEEMHKDFHKKAHENWEKIVNRGTPEELEKIIDGLNTLKRLLTTPKN